MPKNSNYHTFKMFDYEVTVYHVPERPAPCCNNPSSPAFSDPGDDEEFEIISVKTPIHDEDILPFLITAFGDEKVNNIINKHFKEQIQEG